MQFVHVRESFSAAIDHVSFLFAVPITVWLVGDEVCGTLSPRRPTLTHNGALMRAILEFQDSNVCLFSV